MDAREDFRAVEVFERAAVFEADDFFEAAVFLRRVGGRMLRLRVIIVFRPRALDLVADRVFIFVKARERKCASQLGFFPTQSKIFFDNHE